MPEGIDNSPEAVLARLIAMEPAGNFKSNGRKLVRQANEPRLFKESSVAPIIETPFLGNLDPEALGRLDRAASASDSKFASRASDALQGVPEPGPAGPPAVEAELAEEVPNAGGPLRGQGSAPEDPAVRFKKGVLKGLDKRLFFSGLADTLLALSGKKGTHQDRAAAQIQGEQDRFARAKELHGNRILRKQEREEDTRQRSLELKHDLDKQKKSFENDTELVTIREDARTKGHIARLGAENKLTKVANEQEIRFRAALPLYAGLSQLDVDMTDEDLDIVGVANDPARFLRVARKVGAASQAFELEKIQARNAPRAKDQAEKLGGLRTAMSLYSQGLRAANPQVDGSIEPVPLRGVTPLKEAAAQAASQLILSGDMTDPRAVDEAMKDFADTYVRGFEIKNATALGGVAQTLSDPMLRVIRAEALNELNTHVLAGAEKVKLGTAVAEQAELARQEQEAARKANPELGRRRPFAE